MDPKKDKPLDPDSSTPPQRGDTDPHWEEVGRCTSKIPKGAAEILKSYFDAKQMQQAGQYHSFFSSWRDLAGIDIAAHSTPRDIKNRTLVVEADHPGWVQMIHMKKNSILREIRRRFPELQIKDLRILLYSSPRTQPSPPAAPESAQGPESQAESASASTDKKPTAAPGYSEADQKKHRPEKSEEERAEDEKEKSRLNEALKRLGKHLT